MTILYMNEDVSDKKETFMEKAKKVHGELYDYSKSKFIDYKTKIDIICHKHTEYSDGYIFSQLYSNHISAKHGCPKCKGKNKRTSEQFINLAKAKYGDKFNYDNIMYKNSKSLIQIKCNTHNGYIWQEPTNHLRNGGCAICSENKKMTTDEFIEKANKIHNNKYTYEKTIYIKSHSYVTITCKKHGDFSQTSYSHLAGRGCKICGEESSASKQPSTKEEFIEKAKKIHNDKFDYENVNYVNAQTKVLIYCKKHKGTFEQTPDNHLNNNCNICSQRGYSKKAIAWLEYIVKKENIKIQHAENGKELRIDKKLIDGFCKETNTCYEFYGNYWHGNPKMYKDDFVNTVCNKTMKQLYDETIAKEELIKLKGYSLITIWEDEWDKLTP